MTAPSHPRHDLDELIHTPVRLSIVAALAEAASIDFRYLRDLVEVSDSLLSKHLGVLESAGYVHVRKGFEGKRPRTWLSLTSAGQEAFEHYLATLQRITAGAPARADGGSAPDGSEAPLPPDAGRPSADQSER